MFGLGAYGTTILETAGLAFAPAMVLTTAALVLFSLGFGVATIRLHGVYFAMASLALGLTSQASILLAPGLTGGAAGLSSPMLAGGHLGGQIALLSAGLLACVVTSELLLRSRWGTIFFVIRDSPRVASASGLNVTRWRLVALAISTAMAALGGALYAGLFGYINGDDVLNLNWAVLAIAVPVIGGSDSTLGSLIGAIVLVVANEYLAHGLAVGLDRIVYGALLIAVVLGARGGLVGAVAGLRHRLARWRAGTTRHAKAVA
jgi:branched-chain amino acid transport system permease protein